MSAEAEQPVWRDPARPVGERVAALLDEMTLAEKIGQLGSSWVENQRSASTVAPMQQVFGGPVPFEQVRAHGLGHLTRVFGTRPVSPVDGARRVVELQTDLVAGTRLGVPAIVHEECLTGFTTLGATVYPAAIAWAATFDPGLVEQMAEAIGSDMAAVGVHQGLAPVLDVVRDYRWGRVEETLGEDPYLVGTLGAAYVRGLQRGGVTATLKHFAGYSASRGARNHGPVPMGPRELRDMILPAFETAVREGGAGSVMNSYSDIDGVPVGADPALLTGVLRDEWGFEGVVVSDYWSIVFLQTMHRVADSVATAGARALEAGIDVELPETLCYSGAMADLVTAGELDEWLVDRAAGRVLAHKVELGLLDPSWSPRSSVAGAADVDLDSPRNRTIARELAERSVVLLANDGTLPLAATSGTSRTIAVVGPCADDPLTFMGCYSFPNHVENRDPSTTTGAGVEAASLAASMRAEYPDDTVTVHEGCPIRDTDRSGIAAAAEAAAAADVCVAVVGDHAGMFGRGTSGEGCDAEDLSLPGVQDELLDAVLATGTPVVVVVVSGRPYALGAHAPRAAATVQAFMPGEEGGPALAGVLSGRVMPTGRLPVQVPAVAGAQPGTYLQPPLGVDTTGVSNLDPTPAFPFGHGLSYTSYDYDGLQVDHDEIPTDGTLRVSVEVTNTGDRAGEEVVQLYLHDVLAPVTRPVQQLVGFARVPLAAGARTRVAFSVHADRTSFTTTDLRRVVEPGDVEVAVGASVADLRCRTTVRLTGATREVGADRVLTTPVEITALEPVSAC